MFESAYRQRYEAADATHSLDETDIVIADEHKRELKKLYLCILTFQSRTVCRLSQHILIGTARDMFLRDSWNDMLGILKAQEATCQRLFDTIKLEVDVHLREKNQEQRVRSLLDKLDDIRDTIRELHFSDEESRCFEVLRTSDYQAAKDRNPERLPGTCKWLLEHSTYQDWASKASQAWLLWVSADPGCGKSVLAKTMVDQYDSSIVCYFFFKSDNVITRSAAHALCALLHQLCSAQPAGIQHVLPAFRRNGAKLITLFDELWTAFESIVQDPSAGKVICILDALDECLDISKETNLISSRPAAEERRKLLQNLAKMTASSSSLKIFLTSRPYTEIETGLFYKTGLKRSHVRLTGENEAEQASIEEEIEIVIQSRITDFRERRIAGGIDDCAHETLWDHLSSVKNRTYLWISAVFDRLDAEAGAPESELNTIISTLPENVDVAYQNILTRTPKDMQAALKAVLHIMLAAFRPLSIQEMNVALSISKESIHVNMNSLLPKEAFRKWIRDLCGFFITVVRRESMGGMREELFFVHQSARDFLLLKYNDREEKGWRGSFQPAESHAHLARICIDLLQVVCNKTNEKPTELEDYAVACWPEHYQQAALSEDLRQRATCFTLDRCETAASYQSWIKKHRDVLQQPLVNNRSLSSINEYIVGGEPPTPLFLACYYGWVELIKEMSLSGNFNWHQKNRYQQTGLAVASANGQLGVVEFLMTHASSSIINIEDYLALSLEKAAGNGHIEIVQILLDAGANVNCTARAFGGTALQQAASRGHLHVVEKLIAAGADINAKPRKLCGTALQEAASRGHLAVVEKLLAGGAEVNAETTPSSTGTAIQAAASRGSLDVVNILLAAGADVNSAPPQGVELTALQRAARGGHLEVVNRLLAAGAIMSYALPREDGQTALEAAAYSGNLKVVERFLAAGVDVNVTGGYQTALQSAAESGHVNIVKKLLAYSVDVNAPPLTNFGSTELRLAAGAGHAGIVEQFLIFGADVNAAPSTISGRTAIQAAAEAGHQNVVEQLLASGADVNAAPSPNGGLTALQAAAKQKHAGIVEKLISSGADVNGPPAIRWGSTALQYAAKNGDLDIMAKLLACGANPDAPASPGHHMALEGAIHYRQVEAVELLLAAGADVNLHLKRLYQCPNGWFGNDWLSDGWDGDDWVGDDWVGDDWVGNDWVGNNRSSAQLNRIIAKLREAGAKEEFLPAEYRRCPDKPLIADELKTT